jgi:conserved domain protein
LKIFTKEFIRAALIRALKTLCQTAVGCIGAAVALGDVNWPMVASAAVLAAVVSLLTSVAGLPEVEKETANKN